MSSKRIGLLSAALWAMIVGKPIKSSPCLKASIKLIAKERVGNKTIKRYDTAKTSYQRVIERTDISVEAKARLTYTYVKLNPAELRRPIDQKIANLWKISR